VKTILAVLRGREDAERVLDRVIPLAATFSSHVIGFHCEALPAAYSTPVGFPSTDFFEADMAAAEERTAEVKAIFDDRLAKSGMAGEWRATETFAGDSAASALSSAYAADVVIAGQVDPDTVRADIVDLDRLLFDSGRPVILVPYAAPKPRPTISRIIVGWDGSREAARATFDALPLILRADNTEILTVDPRDTSEQSGPLAGAEIAAALSRHGAKVTVESQRSGGLQAGAVIENRLADTQADLLVIGAYSHSRLSQRLFGGVTRTLLSSMPTMTLLSR
jgi:nucleotide-binding universal stress UspA family protein